MRRIQYDPAFIESAVNSVNLLDYAESTYEFKKRGREYFAHCPLHIDKTPSLAINPDNNRFYCHSCGAGGTIIQWLEKVEHLEYDEAVAKAAVLAKLDIQKMCQSQTVLFNRALRRQRMDQTFERRILDYSEYDKFAKEYPQEWIDEGITVDTMKLFDIRIDKDANRIVYPVRDTNGNLINIKGRTRNPDYKKLGVPKYIFYYSVGTMDYLQSLEITKPYAEEKGEIIIFEGIKSVMKAYGYGTKNCVSAEKHSLTDEQIRVLIKSGFDCVFAYDSDVSYNDQTIRRNIEMLKHFVNVYVIEDKDNLLGGAEAKNAPVDCGKDVWLELYENKRKV